MAGGLSVNSGLNRGSGLYRDASLGGTGLSDGGDGASLPSYLSGAAIETNGWAITTAATPPSVTLEYDLTATRQGYDSAGNAASYSAPLYVTRQLRVAGTTTADPTRVGLSEYIFAGDTIAGITNNSTTVSPTPVVNWAMLDRDVVASNIYAAVTAAHLFGMPACVKFTATDGTNTVTQTVSSATAVKKATDANTLVLFEANINVTSLNNGIITVNAEVFPLYGTSGSVISSASTGFNWWEFAPRYFIKDPTRANSLVRCYIDVAGNDTTGVWSTVDATAAASPFLTMTGAMLAARMNATIPAGDYLPLGTPDGCEMRLRAGTFVMANPGATITRGGVVTLTRDPAVARADAIMSLSANRGPNLVTGIPAPLAGGCWRHKDITYTRTGSFYIVGTAGAQLSHQFDNVTLNGGGANAAIAGTNSATFYDGVAYSGGATNSFSSAQGIGLFRGVTGSLAEGTLGCANVIGSKLGLLRTIVPPANASALRNATYQGNYIYSKTSINDGFAFGSVTGLARFNNIFETIGTGSVIAHRVSGDASTGSTDSVFMFHETFVGFDNIGRWNDRYVDTDATGARTHVRSCVRASIISQYNTKHDLFAPANAARVGGWPVDFSVGNDFNFFTFRDAGAGAFAPSYSGRATTTGTSNTVGLDPLFVDFKATTTGPTLGVGDGNYRINSGSPCKDKMLPKVYVPFDADGATRAVTTSIGAFV